jgi:hypothetical protein
VHSSSILSDNPADSSSAHRIRTRVADADPPVIIRCGDSAPFEFETVVLGRVVEGRASR